MGSAISFLFIYDLRSTSGTDPSDRSVTPRKAGKRPALLSPARRAGPSTVLEPLLRPDPPSARTLRAIRRQSGIDQEEVDPTWTRVLFRVCLMSPTGVLYKGRI